MHKIVLAALLALATVNVNAQHHGNAVVGAQPHSEEKPATFLRSHSKQIGLIGDRYEVHSIRIRGLDSPNLTAGAFFDRETRQLLVFGSTGAPGLGGALIGAAGEVGSSFVFGRAIRPDRTNVSNSSNGGVAVSGSSAEGGDADASSSSRSDADADVDVKNTSTNVNSNRNNLHNSQVQVQSQEQQQSQTNPSKPGKGPKSHKHGKGPKNND
jgi:hypothetical protein